MSTSFVEYRGVGFWTWDPYIEHVAGQVADTVLSREDRDGWLTELAEDWKLKSSGGFMGCICLRLDEFLIDERRREELREIIRIVTYDHSGDSPLHKTGIFLLRLLVGQIVWTAASPLDYMVQYDRAYLSKKVSE
jgi:hypothetical protein